jgi:hypothetical protein
MLGVLYDWDDGGNKNEFYTLSVMTDRYHIHETVLTLYHRQAVTI